MARIAGIELSDNWRMEYALTRLKGIGWSRAKKIMEELDLDRGKRVSDLSPQEISNIAGSLEKFDTEGELVRKVRENVGRLQTIGAYRGIRHSRGLPVRGQKTRTNARTKRGTRKTVGAFKKGDLAKQQQTK